MSTRFVMPIQTRPKPESFVWTPTERDRKRAAKNHDQTLERLKERQGMSWCEMAAIVEDRDWRKMGEDEAYMACIMEIARRIAALKSASLPPAETEERST